MTTPTLDPAKIDAAADRAIGYLSGAAISAMVYLGDQLGLYRVLRDSDRLTSTELASRSGLDERWVREWLHSQASAGLLEHGPEGVFGLSAETAAVLADEGHPAFVGGGFALIFPLLQRWDRLFESFRSGRGVPYNDLGLEHAVGESRFSSPWMRANLVPVILPGLDDVVPKLDQGAKVADVGCGSGRALLEMARAYPRSEFHRYDSSEVAIRLAQQNLTGAGLANVHFHRTAASTLAADENFDFILTWDCLHDMTDPAGAMRSIRAAIKPDGTWLIVDINGQPTPQENYRHPLGGLLYAISVLDCLACSTYQEGGAGLGTLGLPEPVARKMVAEAGFTRFLVRDFGNPLNSFYEVRP
jgi:2-polyprenyl-3-methyl-5-hydroxy-6-metoxy-1,4-benzoquinol methylase